MVNTENRAKTALGIPLRWADLIIDATFSDEKSGKAVLNAHSVVPIQLGPTGPQVPLEIIENDRCQCRRERRVWPVAPTSGIGTTVPASSLDIIASTILQTSAGLNVRHSSLTQGIAIGYAGLSASGSNPNQDIILTPKGGGGVGIGTTSAASLGSSITTLDLRGASGGGIYTGVNGTANGTFFSWSDGNVYAGATAAGSNLILTAGGGGERVRITSTGNVGIGTTAPAAALQITSGQVAGAYLAANSATINLGSANVQSTNVAAGVLTFVTGSMLNGANYTLVINNAAGGSYTLSSTDVSTWKCIPTCPANQITVTPGKDTLLTLIKVGTTAYVSWIQGF